MNLQGTITALITPFKEQQLDEEGLIHNLRFQIKSGVNGVLLLGTTGEASTLSREEKDQVINMAVQEAKGKVDIWVGSGSYCTRQTIDNTKRAKDLGADGVLIVTPYYNKPTQEGLFRHFEAISQAVEIPIMLYNIPGRCGTNMETSTVLRIASLPNIIGIKEASGSIQQAGDMLHLLSTKYPHFKVFSGDDALTLPMMALGAVGVVSVASNLLPSLVVALSQAALQGDFQTAKEIHHYLHPFFKAAFIETNPVPIKTAMSLCGLPAGNCRLPLYDLKTENVAFLRHTLMEMELIKRVQYA